MPGTPIVFVSSASKLSKWSTACTITARIKAGVCALHFLICLCIGSPINVSVNGYHFATITVISETCDVFVLTLAGCSNITAISLCFTGISPLLPDALPLVTFLTRVQLSQNKIFSRVETDEMKCIYNEQ